MRSVPMCSANWTLSSAAYSCVVCAVPRDGVSVAPQKHDVVPRAMRCGAGTMSAWAETSGSGGTPQREYQATPAIAGMAGNASAVETFQKHTTPRSCQPQQDDQQIADL